MKQTVFLFLFLSVFQINSFAQVSSEVSPSAETVPAPLASGTYSRLLHDVRTAFARGEERTADAVRILIGLGGLWRIAGVFLWLVPLPLRDLGYRWVAANRYRWFGKFEVCRLPNAQHVSRFLP